MSQFKIPGLEHIPYSVRPFAGWPYTLPAPTPRKSYSKPSAQQPQGYSYKNLEKVDEDKDWSNTVFDYNDPLEVNSLADVLFNEAALNRHYAQADDKPGFDLADLTQRVQAGVDVLKKTFVTPIQEKGVFGNYSGFADVGLNMITGLEIMDVLANPVKGAFLDPEGPLAGIRKGFGIGPEGRVNYDIDLVPGTNADVVANMALEVVADPFTWLSMGLSAAAKKAAKPLLGAAAKGVKEVAEELTPELLQQGTDLARQMLDPQTLHRVTNTIYKSVRQRPDNVIEAVSRGMAAAKLPYNEASQAFAKQFSTRLADKISQNLMDDAAIKAIRNVERIMQAGKIVDKVEASLFKAAVPPVPLAWYVIKPGASKVADYVAHAVHPLLKQAGVLRDDGLVKITQMDLAQNILRSRGEAIWKRGDVPTNLEDQLAFSMYLTSHEADINSIRQIFKTHAQDVTMLMKELDDYCLRTSGVVWDDYLKQIQSFAGKHPLYQEYADMFRTQQEILETIQRNPYSKETRAIIRELNEKMDAGISRVSEFIDELPSATPVYKPLVRDAEMSWQLRQAIKTMTDVAEQLSTLADEGAVLREAFAEAGESLRPVYVTNQAGEKIFARFEYVADGGTTRTFADPEYVEGLLASVQEQLSYLLEAQDNRAFTSMDMRNIARLQRTIEKLQKLDEFSELLAGFDFDLAKVYAPDLAKLPETVADRLVAYSLKEMQAAVQTKFMSMPALRNLLKDYQKYGRNASIFDAVLPEHHQELEQVLDKVLEGHQSFDLLLRKLKADPVLAKSNYFVHIFDTLQKYARRDMNIVISEGDAFADEFLESLQSQLVSLTQNRRYSLEVLYSEPERLQAFKNWAAQKYPGVEVGQAHSALNDTLEVEFLFESSQPLAEYKDLIYGEDAIPVFFDVESYGLKGGKHPLLQLTWVVDGKVKTYNARITEPMLPSAPVLDKLVGGSDETAVQKFLEQYQNQANPQEAEILREFMTDLRNLEAETGKHVRLMGHNIDGFDVDYLLKRVYKSGEFYTKDWAYIKNSWRVDTLKMLYRKDGIPILTTQVQDHIRTSLNDYIRYRSQQSRTMGQDRRFIDTFNFDVAQKLRQMRDDAKIEHRFYSPQAAQNQVQDLIDYYSLDVDERAQLEFVQEFTAWGAAKHEIKTELDELLEQFFEASKDKVTDAGHVLDDIKIYYDPDTSVFYNARMEILTPANGAVHVMQLFNNKLGEMYTYGVRKSFVARELPRFFDIPADRKLDAQYLETLYEIFKKIDKAKNGITDLKIIAPYHAMYEVAIEQLAKGMVSLHKHAGLPPPKVIDLLKVPLGTEDRYALAHWMHQYMNRFAANHNAMDYYKGITRNWTGGIKLPGEYSPLQLAMKTIIEPDSFGMRFDGRFVSPTEIASKFMQPTRTKLWQQGEMWEEGLGQVLESLGNQVTNLGILRDQTGVSSAMTQAALSFLRPFKESWGRIDDYFMSLSDDARPSALLEAKFVSEMRTDGKAVAELYKLAKYTPAQLAEELWHLRYGVFTFSSKNSGTQEKFFIDSIAKDFQQRSKELAAADIWVHYDPLEERLWVGLENSEALIARYKEQYKRTAKDVLTGKERLTAEYKAMQERAFVEQKPFYQVPESQADRLLAAEEADMLSRIAEHTDNRVLGTLGDAFERSNLEALHKAAPDVLQAKLLPISLFTDDLKAFGAMQFNRSNIGTINSRKMIEPYISRNILKNYTMTGQWLAQRLEDRIKYRYIFFDDMWQLNGPQYANLSDQELYEIFKDNPALKTAYLVADKKLGARMVEFFIRSVADIRQARQLGVVALSPQTYLEAWKGINKLDVPPTIMRALNKFIIQPMKLGFITSPGMVMRNLIDSAGKNMTMTEGVHEIPQMTAHTLETWRIYTQYKQIFQQVVAHPKNNKPVFSRRILEKLYQEAPNQAISIDMFQFMHDAVEQMASASISQAQKLEIAKQAGWYSRHVLNNIATRTILDINSEIENVVRLTAYTWQLMNGATIDEAMMAVLRTHFDYSVKSRARQYAEYVVPFFGFIEQNMMFWLRLLNEKGWAGTLFSNLMTPIWNLDETESIELNDNKSLQYHVLAGNIVLDNNLVLKLNPSVLDALRLVSDPNEALGRLNPIIRGIKSYRDDPEQNVTKLIATNIPMVGPTLMRYWAPESLRNQLPGLESILDLSYLKESGLDRREWGSAWKSASRITNDADKAALLFPSIFGGALRLYYVAFPTGDVLVTPSETKMLELLDKGAVQIVDPDTAASITATEDTRGLYWFAFPNSGAYVTNKPEKIAEMLARGAFLLNSPAEIQVQTDKALVYALQPKNKTSMPRPRKPLMPRAQRIRVPYDNMYSFRYGPGVFNEVIKQARGRQQKLPRTMRGKPSRSRSNSRKQKLQSVQGALQARMVPVTKDRVVTALKQAHSYLR